MKILVCGSEGRIMSKAIPRLLEQGHEVIGVDHCEKWGAPQGGHDYRFVQGDCSDPAVLRPLMKGVEGVIQAAATLFGVVGFHKRCADILSEDLAVHRATLKTALEAGVSRVVFLSSSMVYERCETEPHREADADRAPIPATDYGLSKIVGERLTRAFHEQYGLPYTIWRPFNALDPAEEGGDEPGVSHVFADFARRIVLEQQNPLEILGDGLQVRSFVHIDEVAEAIADYSFDERSLGEVYNVGRDEPVTMRGLALALHDKARRAGLIADQSDLTFIPLPVPAADVRRRVGSFEKIASELGWVSRRGLDETLGECIEHVAHLLQRRGAPAAADA